MPIQVTCPGCLSRFTVSEKFAGKKGPCPKCKKEITIPDASQEVVIHAPEVEGPTDSQGKAVLKPIRREYVALSKAAWGGIIGGVVLVLVGAVVLRIVSNGSPNGFVLALGAILIAPPLIVAGYGFLRDSELEGYTGKEMLVRTTICSAIFAITWGLYALISRYFENPTLADTPLTQMSVLMVAMVVIGTFASLMSLELEFGQAVLHYLLYLVVTLILCAIVGLSIGEVFSGSNSQRPGVPKRPGPRPPVKATLEPTSISKALKQIH